MDPHHAINDLLFLDHLDRVCILELQLDGITARPNLVRDDPDRVKDGRQTIPLCLVLARPFGLGDRVDEGGRGRPEGEVLERRVTREELRARVSARIPSAFSGVSRGGLRQEQILRGPFGLL